MVALGTISAQVVLIIATPLLTRLFGPEAFGALGSVVALTGIVGPVAALCLPLAIVVAQDRSEIGALAMWSAAIGVFPAVGTAVLSPYLLGEVVDAGVSGTLLSAITAMLIYSAVLHQIVHQSLLKLQWFKWISIISLIQAVVFVMLQIGVGLTSPTPSRLVAISGLNFVLFLPVAFAIPGVRRRALSTVRSAKHFRSVFVKYGDFSAYRAPQLLANTLGTYLPILVLAWYVDLIWVGFLAVTQRLLGLPSQLLARSITDVLYPKFSVMSSSGVRLFPSLLRWSIVCAGLATAVSLVILLAAEPVYILVLGSEWGAGAALAMALVPWMWASLASRPAVAAIPTLGLQRKYLAMELVVTAVKSLVLVALLASGAGVVLSLLVWSLISGLGGMYITIIALFRSRVMLSSPMRYGRGD